MNKWTLKSLAAAAVGLMAFAGQASAAVSYSYVTDASTYTASAPGQAVTVKLYLLETLSGADVGKSVITEDTGLFGYGIRVNRTAGTGLITNYSGNDADFATFPNPKPTVPAGGVATYQFAQGISPSAASGILPGNGGANSKTSAVFLGTVDITAGATNSTFQVLPYTGGGQTITNSQFYDLDSNGTTHAPTAGAPQAFTGAGGVTNTFVVQVPEPGFAGVVMVLGAVGSLIRRRRQLA